MKIKSKSNNVEHIITEEDWKKITDRGDARRYEIIKEKEEVKIPEELGENYEALLKKAKAAKKRKSYVKALEHYRKLSEIKPTKDILEAIDELEELVEPTEEK